MKNRLILLSNRLLLGILLIMCCGQVCGMRLSLTLSLSVCVFMYIPGLVVEPLATNCAWRIYQRKNQQKDEFKDRQRQKKRFEHWQKWRKKYFFCLIKQQQQQQQWIRIILDDFSFLINSYSTFFWLDYL